MWLNGKLYGKYNLLYNTHRYFVKFTVVTLEKEQGTMKCPKAIAGTMEINSGYSQNMPKVKLQPA